MWRHTSFGFDFIPEKAAPLKRNPSSPSLLPPKKGCGILDFGTPKQ